MRIRGYAPATPCLAELYSTDLDGAVAFYRDLFGWQANQTELGTTVFQLGQWVAASLRPAPPGAASGWLTYISTEDIDGTAELVTAAGGAVRQPPMEIGARGRSAVFADAEGASFAVWQRGSFNGAQVANEPNAVCWSDLGTRDLAGALAFYGKVFGWVDQPGELASGFDYWDLSVNNRVVAGVTTMGPQVPAQVPPHWRTTVEVDDCAATVARCTELGGQAVIGPLDVGAGQYAQLIDPQGAALGVIALIPQLRLTL